MNTKRSGSRRACQAFHRRHATSARLCSRANRGFFEAQPLAPQNCQTAWRDTVIPCVSRMSLRPRTSGAASGRPVQQSDLDAAQEYDNDDRPSGPVQRFLSPDGVAPTSQLSTWQRQTERQQTDRSRHTQPPIQHAHEDQGNKVSPWVLASLSSIQLESQIKTKENPKCDSI